VTSSSGASRTVSARVRIERTSGRLLASIALAVALAGCGSAGGKSPKPSLPGQREQAVERARKYLSDGEGFSRTGLIHQLSSKYGEGFPKAVAVFAVDHVNANWYEQAVVDAKGYEQQLGGFSCSALIGQLAGFGGDHFTHAQAVYGARKTGVC
jgi:Host cell surface-exposed lipoprotein